MTELKDKIMSKIENKEVTMKPKEFFLALKIGAYILIGALILGAVFFSNLGFYLPRRGMIRGMMNQSLIQFSWLYIVIAAILTVITVILLERYTNAYRRKLAYVFLTVILGVLFLGYLVSNTGLNRRFENHPRFKRLYDQDFPGMRGQGRRQLNQLPYQLPQNLK